MAEHRWVSLFDTEGGSKGAERRRKARCVPGPYPVACSVGLCWLAAGRLIPKDQRTCWVTVAKSLLCLSLGFLSCEMGTESDSLCLRAAGRIEELGRTFVGVVTIPNWEKRVAPLEHARGSAKPSVPRGFFWGP